MSQNPITSEQSETEFDARPMVNGRRVDAAGSTHCEKHSPDTGESVAALTESSDKTVDAALKSARACADWADATPGERKAVLLSVADRIDEIAESIAMADSFEMGKPISAARWDTQIASGYFRFFAEAIDKHHGLALPRTPGAAETQQYRPKGVVAAITPWNFPSINAALKAAPALAAGNTLVMKPSEIATYSTLLMSEVAIDAGLPPGAWNVVTGGGNVGAALIRHRDADMITFTGSTNTGLGIVRSVGETAMKSMLLECGGKSPALVFADAVRASSAGALAESLVNAALWNCGQVCVARSRIYVERPVFDTMAEEVIDRCSKLSLGRPYFSETQYGPLANSAQYGRVLQAIERGVSDGATLALDGRDADKPAAGFYVGPSIFLNAPQDSSLVQEEIFGPVISVSAFDTDEEAISLANDSQFGLAASVFTGDFARAHNVADRIQAGMVAVYASPSDCMPPWTAHSAEPIKQSGFGAEGGMAGLASYTTLKSTQFIYG